MHGYSILVIINEPEVFSLAVLKKNERLIGNILSFLFETVGHCFSPSKGFKSKMVLIIG